MLDHKIRIAIVHYHLRPGGVTRVIERAVSSLQDEVVEVAVLCGEAPRETSAMLKNVAVVDGLAYAEGPETVSADLCADRLLSAASNALGGAPDIWHVHNHALGKNNFLPAAVDALARRGCRMLLQIHDFAEDGRPEDFSRILEGLGQGDIARLGARLYPQAPHVHYAVLNQRDYDFLLGAGAEAAQLHLLPNAVCMNVSPQAGEERGSETPYVVYPVRAIRRKNLGEFLLWAAVSEDMRFAVTLAPENPLARPVYDRWTAFAEEQNLPVEFDATNRRGASYEAILQQADALATTSVAEGFGLAFLEPWLVGRPLVGRDLPEITAQFASAGIDLSNLYQRLDVPLEWIGEETLRDKIGSALERHFRSYGKELQTDDVDKAFAAFVRDDFVDFGRLDEPLQERVIERLIASPNDKKLMIPSALEIPSAAQEQVERNRQIVQLEFSLEHYGASLMDIYKSILASTPASPGALSAETLLAEFLDPARFNLLRTH